ncbi:hypothetical protein DFP72DRAFT_847352 [Ephemerocybe angulata]|uniref:DUF6533 domain-containing protein n=1 Tax=Ephemerocybe angulata TaxID=980116 RepID=A0A8H6HYU7_9AGAR|nr:hypothetical protein DFP72DRAFT_847352 [Tulosesus angulatus]
MSLTAQEILRLRNVFSIAAMQEVITQWALSNRHGTYFDSKVASYAFNLYYYVTTLKEEVATIWPQKARTGKALYFFNRYAPLYSAFMSATKACTGLWIFTSIGNAPTMIR